MTFAQAIAALAAKLGVTDAGDGVAVAEALRVYSADLEVPRTSESRRLALRLEAFIHRRNGAEVNLALAAPDLIALLP